MDIVSGLIDSLELNLSLFIQLGIFLVSYVVLHYLLFKPYNIVAQKRFDATTGSLESATQFDEEIELLKREYGKAVKETNEKIKGIYDSTDASAKKEVQEIVMKAQSEYLAEKTTRSKEIEANYQEESKKIPLLSQNLKDSLKRVLLGA